MASGQVKRAVAEAMQKDAERVRTTPLKVVPRTTEELTKQALRDADLQSQKDYEDALARLEHYRTTGSFRLL